MSRKAKREIAKVRKYQRGRRVADAWAMQRMAVDLTERDAENERLRKIVEGATMARTRLEMFADQANAGQVHYDARELKRRIWASFADFDTALVDEQEAVSEKRGQISDG